MTATPSAAPAAPGPGAAPTSGALLERLLGRMPPSGLVLLALLSIQLGAALATRLFEAFGPAGTVSFRIVFAALVLTAAFRPRVRAVPRGCWPWILLLGAAIAGMNLCFYEAIARIPLGVAVAVEFLGPLAIALATSRRLLDLLWILLAAAGLWLLTPQIAGATGGGLDRTGLLFALSGGLCWTGFILVSRQLGRRLPGHGGLALAMIAAAAISLPIGLPAIAAGSFGWLALAGAVAVALLSTAFPFSLEYAALRRLPPRTYAVLVTLEPAVASLVGVLLLAQGLSPASLGAVAAITVAALGATLSGRGATGT
ncbi:inner membrane transporter RhtA [Tistlia consotensis]|uniref:Inner membrane transporter RhtA n=1 Tax=Tistlia consotensis USBA 355 TaxID=560819 RepID=A0A1Y6B648_9PROT|nr:EamA family transporter [Tistlia consotensis]SME92794.1 inner membrane transporter RhtA [Tistlia consotensis USBA 355]SNR28242.1 inner membrane transporter RhtA [Tistlia consotensis]